MPKGVPNKRYTPEFKKLVVETMQKEKLSCKETARRFGVGGHTRITDWERIYLSELLYLQEFQSMEHFKLELIEYPDYYNNRRIKAKLKGLPPAIHRQQALSAA